MSAEMDLGGVMSYHQWELVQAIVKILQPIEEATCTVCEDVASLSSVIPCVQALKTALTNLKVDADVQALPEALKMVTTLRSQLDQHFQAVFDDSSGHYFKATLLDP
ncbi:zinc finger BED domain-containing protein 4-like isoform X1 [Tachysurus ichikawai]